MEEIAKDTQVVLGPLLFHEIAKVSYLASHYSGDNDYRKYPEADVGITLAALMNNPDEKIIAARVGEEIVGGIIGALERHIFNRSLIICKVRTIIVHRAYRKLGVGQKLLAELEGWAKGRGARCVIMGYHEDSLMPEVEAFMKGQGYSGFKREVKKEV